MRISVLAGVKGLPRKLGAGLLRLVGDRAGNALGITAGTIMLLVAMAGAGTDMSRAYMTKTSLQAACDAGVLAGRKAMAKSGSYGTAETAKATKMFNFNFRPTATNSQLITFTTSANNTGSVLGTATTTMPTTIMRVFGYRSIPMTAKCSAELQMASADVMFVLDNTGSMAYDVTNTTCCNQSNSKIVGLRDAVKDFYKTVAGAVLDKVNTRIRFGFVPYSMTTNVKDLVTSGALPGTYISDTANYQTEQAYFNTPYYVGTAGTVTNTTETYASNISSTNCTNYGNNAYPTNGGNPVASGGPAPATTYSTKYTYGSWTLVSGSLGTCKRNKAVTPTTYVTQWRFTNYRYIQGSVDVSAFKGFGNVALASGFSGTSYVSNQGAYNLRDLATGTGTGTTGNITTSTYAWSGCIEERSTAQQLSMSPVPSTATDLDLTSAPSSEATKWKPYLEMLEYPRGNYLTSLDTTSAYTAQTGYCPAPMKQFTTVDTTDPTTVPTWLNTYLNGLAAVGGTYHDIGMIWGGRLANPSGIFSANVNAGNLPSISRHVIFMTDGIMEPYNQYYTAYGTEMYDNRVSPSGTNNTTLTNYHNNRFLAVCQKVKDMGYTVWVIGFGQTLTTQMQTCASAGRAYYASDTTALKNTFKFIAGQVADLRINQ